MPVNVLEIGSSEIRLMVANKGVNHTFSVISDVCVNYPGFYEGEFVKPSEFKENVKEAITRAESESKQKIKELVVGVPSEFSSAIAKEGQITFSSKKVINKDDISNLFETNNELAENKTITLVSTSATNYVLDDGRVVENPVSQKTQKLSGNLTFIYAETTFINYLNEILKEVNIEKVEYVSEPLSTVNYILNKEEKEHLSVVIDSGYITTSVILSKGNGILGLSSFSMGSGHIITDFIEALDLSFEEAEQLKNQIVLSLSNKTGGYEIFRDGKVERIPYREANEIVAYRLELIGQGINKCLSMFQRSYPAYLPVFITGGALTFISGAKDYLAKCMGRNVILAFPPQPILDKPEYSSRLGLVNLALNSQKKKQSILANIFKR